MGVLSGRAPGADPADLDDVRRTLGARRHEVRHVEDTDPAGRILREARLGVGVVTLGINDDYRGSHRLSEPIQRVIADSPVPLLLVRRGERVRDAADLDGRALRRIVVGVTGTVAGRAAEEVACGLANRRDGRVRAVHVLQRSAERGAPEGGAGVDRGEDADGPGARQLARVRGVATAFGVRDLTTAVVEGPVAADELGRAAEAWQADVVVVGTVLRAVEGRPFLGHGTEWLLENAPQTVVVVALPVRGADE
ncbi:MAG: universal stress protein [Nitriliruptoraceae bacterium]